MVYDVKITQLNKKSVNRGRRCISVPILFFCLIYYKCRQITDDFYGRRIE